MARSCCGLMHLHKACLVTATMEIVLACAFLLYNVIILAEETPLAVKEQEDGVNDPFRFRSIRVVLSGLNALFWIGCLFLGFILTLAAKERDLRKLRSWFILTCILTVLFIVDILIEAFSMRAPVIAIISPTVGTVLQCYMLWLVTEFMDEVSRGACAPITAKSLEEDA